MKIIRRFAMKTLFKLIFKLIWRGIVAVASAVGIVLALNKFSPDTLDSLNGWLKDQRND